MNTTSDMVFVINVVSLERIANNGDFLVNREQLIQKDLNKQWCSA